MQTAWRERNPEVRIKSARSALDLNPECASAYILLAEEECTSIVEVEKKLKIALKHAENNYRKSQLTQHQSSAMEALHSGSLLQYFVMIVIYYLSMQSVYCQWVS